MDEKEKAQSVAELKDPGNGKPPPDTKFKSETPKRIEVKLAKPHRHRGVLYQPGDTIELRPDQAERLKKQGVIR